MLKSVKVYSFDNIKKGEDTIGRTNCKQIGEKIVNPNFITLIEKSESIEFVLYYVRICKQSVQGHHDFYTDYEGMLTLKAGE
jgi:hypothetical protein